MTATETSVFGAIDAWQTMLERHAPLFSELLPGSAVGFVPRAGSGIHPGKHVAGVLNAGGEGQMLTWVMDGQRLLTSNKAPVGALTWGDVRVIASADSLYLYLPDGQLVDKLSGTDLPNRLIKRLGIIGSGSTPKLVLSTAQGNFVSDDGLTWQALIDDQPVWASEQALPSKVSASLNKSFGPSLPLERIILDLHSGRIFGHYGPMLMDIVAIGLIILSLSGVWIYLRTLRRKSRH